MDHLLALLDAAPSDHLVVIELPHPAAPGWTLELTYDGGGILVASWRYGETWVVVEVGEA